MMRLAAEKPIIPHTDKQQLKSNIMAKKVVKSKASKPAPKKAAAKKGAEKEVTVAGYRLS